MATFVVPEQFAGKTLSEIQKETGKAFRPDLLGFDQNSKLQSGQTLTFKDDPGSAEFQFLNTTFTPQAQFQANQATKKLQESSGAAIKTLQSGSDPLKQRYDELIANIRQTGEQETKRADIASAQELAKRGISLESGIAPTFQQERRMPVQTAFQGQEANAALSAETAQQNIRSAIAQIQAATGVNEVNAIMQAYQQAEQERQFNENLGFQREQFNFQKEQADKQPTSTTNLQTVTFGDKLYSFDPSTGAIVSLASKGGGGGATPFVESNWE